MRQISGSSIPYLGLVLCAALLSVLFIQPAATHASPLMQEQTPVPVNPDDTGTVTDTGTLTDTNTLTGTTAVTSTEAITSTGTATETDTAPAVSEDRPLPTTGVEEASAPLGIIVGFGLLVLIAVVMLIWVSYAHQQEQ